MLDLKNFTAAQGVVQRGMQPQQADHGHGLRQVELDPEF
jgi:hypothetical protein